MINNFQKKLKPKNSKKKSFIWNKNNKNDSKELLSESYL
jgi:hypothetical protein